MKSSLTIFFLILYFLGPSQNLKITPLESLDFRSSNINPPVYSSKAIKVFNAPQIINGIKVFGTSQKLVVTNNQEYLVSISNKEIVNYQEIVPWKEIDTSTVLNQLNFRHSLYDIENLYYPENQRLIPTISIKFSNSATHLEQWIVDKTGTVLEKFNLLHLNHTSDSIVKVWVFNPDPLTTSNTNYGDVMADSNDQNSVLLEQELKQLEVNLIYDSTSNSFLPENQYAKIEEFSSPVVIPTNFSNPIPKYTRNQTQFEEINILYHLSNFQKHLSIIGFNSLVDYQIAVDAHGFGGADQSSFNELHNPPRLTFGTGGVDDAEDADVIIHEFGHAIYYAVNPTAQLGLERIAIEEAFGDYLAASYSRNLNPFNWHRVYNWDGHNEFWPGRVVNSAKTYPSGIKNNIYQDAEIFSAALMEVWEVLGRGKTDRLVIESAALHLDNMTMKDAAYLFIYTNDISNAGESRNDICQIFLNRGLIDHCPSVGLAEVKENKNQPYFHNGKIWFNYYLEAPIHYQISDLQGRLISEGKIADNSINIERGLNGLLLLRLNQQTFKVFIPQ